MSKRKMNKKDNNSFSVIMKIEYQHDDGYEPSAFDLSDLSLYPDEEEFILLPFTFLYLKNFNINSDKYTYEPLLSKSFPFIINKGPILIDNKNKEENSFYCLANNSVLKVTVLNDKSDHKNIETGEENNCVINIINVDKVKALVYLTIDKNIIFDTVHIFGNKI